VIDFRDRLFMIDCGEGAQLQFRRMGLKFSRLRHIFISHLHGDHLFGLPGLLSTMDLHQVEGTVTVHIFPDGARLLKEWMDYFCRSEEMKIEYDIITPGRRGIIYEDHALTVEAFPLYHRTECSGFIFREKPKPRHINGEMAKYYNVPAFMLPRIKAGEDFTTPDGTVVPNLRLTTDPDPAMSYAYCSDTSMNPRVAEAVKGVDTIYHEATYDDSLAATARERGHSTAREAATIAAMAGARRLIIGHYSKRYNNEQILLDQAREAFPDVTLANEGLKIDLL